MTPEEAIEMLRGMQNKKVDYAEMVCAPAFAYGYEYVYPEPEDYAIEEAIKALKEIQQYRKSEPWKSAGKRWREPDHWMLTSNRYAGKGILPYSSFRKLAFHLEKIWIL